MLQQVNVTLAVVSMSTQAAIQHERGYEHGRGDLPSVAQAGRDMLLTSLQALQVGLQSGGNIVDSNGAALTIEQTTLSMNAGGLIATATFECSRSERQCTRRSLGRDGRRGTRTPGCASHQRHVHRRADPRRSTVCNSHRSDTCRCADSTVNFNRRKPTINASGTRAATKICARPMAS